MGERKALGKGLSALLGQRPAGPAATVAAERSVAGRPLSPQSDPAPLPASGVHLVPISKIEPNPDQPREAIDDATLKELAASVAKDGVIQPIVVRQVEDCYQLIAGERRWRAARLAGLETIPALVHTVHDPADSLRLALVENIQREDLNPLEEARAYRELIQRCGLTQEQLAEQVCKNRSTVTNTLRLLNLPADIQALLAQGKIMMGHARALLACDTESVQRKVAEQIVADELSVRAVERLISGGSGAAKKGTARSKPTGAADPHLAQLERTLRERLGTKVRIQPSGKAGGRIVIEYYSGEELEGLLERLGAIARE